MAEWKSETVPLTHPISGAGDSSQKITSITLHEPNVEALELIQEAGFTEGAQPTVKQLRTAIAALARIDPDLLLTLHRDDFTKLAEKAVPFVTGSVEPSPPESSPSSSSTSSSQT